MRHRVRSIMAGRNFRLV